MADITVDLSGSEIVNNEVFSSTTTVTVIISANETINASIVSDDLAQATNIPAISTLNTNTVSIDTIITLSFALDSVVNTSTVSIPWYIDYNIITILSNDIVNTNIVSNIDYLVTFRKYPDEIINTNFVSDVIIGTNKIYALDSIINSNIISQPTLTLENIPITTTFNTRTSINRPINTNYVFSDISLDFLAHPITGDIAILYDYDAINQSLLNIIGTQRFERPFESYSVASRIKTLLFELSGNLLLNELRSELFAAIVNNEPRILLYDIIVYENFEENSIGVQIFYKIKTFDRIEQLNTIISRT